MAFPLVHLIIADRILPYFSVRSISDYYVGTIAPDAIGVRSDWSRDEKRLLHLIIDSRNLDRRINAARDFYDDNAETRRDFHLGYVIHIHVDHLWSHLIARYYREAIVPQVTQRDMMAIYYSDLAVIDRLLMSHYERSKLIMHELLDSAQNYEVMILRSEDIEQWKR